MILNSLLKWIISMINIVEKAQLDEDKFWQKMSIF